MDAEELLINLIMRNWNISKKSDVIPIFSRKLIELENYEKVNKKIKSMFNL